MSGDPKRHFPSNISEENLVCNCYVYFHIFPPAVMSCGIYGGQSGTIPPVLRFPFNYDSNNHFVVFIHHPVTDGIWSGYLTALKNNKRKKTG
jgi:hypothetical protein